MTKPSRWVMEILNDFHHYSTLIDVACGKGRHVKKLMRRFKVTAVDYDVEALKEFKKLKNVHKAFLKVVKNKLLFNDDIALLLIFIVKLYY